MVDSARNNAAVPNSADSSVMGGAPAIPSYIPRESREWFRAGFFLALGAGILALLALLAGRLAQATLAVITPFAIALVLTLLLDPVADRLEQRGLSRFASVAAVFGIFLVIFAALCSLFIPSLIDQAGRLSVNGPDYVQSLRANVNAWLAVHRRIGAYVLPSNFDAVAAQISDRMSAFVRSSSSQLTGILLGSISKIFDLLIMLIITFYLLLDIDRLRARFFFLLPESVRGSVRKMAEEIGGVFSRYLRGLMIVCALYGASTLLLLYGLSLFHSEIARYALLVGAAAGLLYAVPYIGALVTVLLTFLVAFAAGGAAFGGIAAGLLLAVNQVFDNIVTPRVVGGGVGLHPVVAVFSLTLGAQLFGLWGMLLSVPVAGSIQAMLQTAFPKLARPTPENYLTKEGSGLSESKSPHIPA